MTPADFHRLYVDPKTAGKLDRMIEANRVLDEELAAIRQKEIQDEAVTRYLRSFFQHEHKAS